MYQLVQINRELRYQLMTMVSRAITSEAIKIKTKEVFVLRKQILQFGSSICATMSLQDVKVSSERTLFCVKISYTGKAQVDA